MFEIKSVSKKYNQEFALNNISMNINKGMNFIIGASGSGKTTLLKAISGLEQDFDGDVLYCGKSIKTLSANEKGYFYNNIIGFVWQDFNLLEDNTVLENILLPRYLKETKNRKTAEKILKDLKIFDLALRKVKYLSGGQKQRVAIARELMKSPQVIIADEPTSALDEKTSKSTIDILRMLSKNRIVIVVTHDTSLISQNDYVYELDKGELIKTPNIISNKASKIEMQNFHKLSFKNAFSIAKTNIKNKVGRFIISTIALLIASILLLTSVSGVIAGNGEEEFKKLFDTYGDALTDISIISSFTDAAGTDNKDDKKPSGDVTQNLNGLFELYAKDTRISFIAYLQAFNDIKIKVEGKDYKIESSGNVPSINKLIAGAMPMGEENEVVIPESFTKKMGLSPEKAIGKEIDFSGSIVNWSSGSPVYKNTNSKAKIVGVMDTTVVYDYEGKTNEFDVEDSFFFSKSALDSMTKQADISIDTMDFLLRVKTPSDMIEIKDELSGKGIVPLGRFELVEDMVRVNNQTTKQSSSVSSIISILSIIMVVAIILITTLMRKKEFAIYKVSGFTTAHLFVLNFAEILFVGMAAIACLLIFSPFLNLATKELFSVNILSIKMLFTGAIMVALASIVAYITSAVAILKVKVKTALKSGDR